MPINNQESPPDGHIWCEVCTENYAEETVGGVLPNGERGYYLCCKYCKKIIMDERKNRRL